MLKFFAMLMMATVIGAGLWTVGILLTLWCLV